MALDLNRFKAGSNNTAIKPETAKELNKLTGNIDATNQTIDNNSNSTTTNDSTDINDTTATVERLDTSITIQTNSNNSVVGSTITSQAPAESNGLDMLILVNLNELQARLEAANPDIKTNMAIIHKGISKDPAQVTILSLEQRAILFAGYSKLSGIDLTTKTESKAKRVKPEDIMME